MYVTDGDAASLIALFKLDGEFVSPSSATYTLRDHTGAKVVAQTNIDLGLTGGQTQAVVNIAGNYNALTGGHRIENRAVEVAFVLNGQTFKQRQTYKVSEYLNFSAQPSDVRALLGVFDHELTDAEIDLTSAYYTTEAALTKAIMDAAVVTGDITNLNVNSLIVAQAAMDCMTSLKLRVMQHQQDENVQFERLAKLDLNDLFDDLSNTIAGLTVALSGVNANQETLIVLAGGSATDVITGA